MTKFKPTAVMAFTHTHEHFLNIDSYRLQSSIIKASEYVQQERKSFPNWTLPFTPVVNKSAHRRVAVSLHKKAVRDARLIADLIHEDCGGRCVYCDGMVQRANAEFDMVLPVHMNHALGARERHIFLTAARRVGLVRLACQHCNNAKGASEASAAKLLRGWWNGMMTLTVLDNQNDLGLGLVLPPHKPEQHVPIYTGCRQRGEPGKKLNDEAELVRRTAILMSANALRLARVCSCLPRRKAASCDRGAPRAYLLFWRSAGRTLWITCDKHAPSGLVPFARLDLRADAGQIEDAPDEKELDAVCVGE
jgi:hypothetical protein